MFQRDFQLRTDRTVHENLKFVVAKASAGKPYRNRDVQELKKSLQQVGAGKQSTKCLQHELSGGRTAAYRHRPGHTEQTGNILADEPTGNLDVETGRRIVELLQDICCQGLSLLMTHAQPQLAFGAHPEKCTNANIAVSRERQIHRQKGKRMPK